MMFIVASLLLIQFFQVCGSQTGEGNRLSWITDNLSSFIAVVVPG